VKKEYGMTDIRKREGSSRAVRVELIHDFVFGKKTNRWSLRKCESYKARAKSGAFSTKLQSSFLCRKEKVSS
jgi:hypothetical protein